MIIGAALTVAAERGCAGASRRTNLPAVRTLILSSLLVPALSWSAATADDVAVTDAAAPAPEPGAPTFRLGGYVQPQARLRQDDAVAQFDEDGFRFRRARLTLAAHRAFGQVEYEVEVESELTPDFQLLDAYLAASACLAGDGRWRVAMGQLKAPVSRQTLLSDSRLSFVAKAELQGLAPDRQLGALGGLTVPYLPQVTLQAGVFNGEGRNQVQNVDQRFLYAGRLEVRPFGRGVPLTESAHDGDYLAVAMSAARNRTGTGVSVETALTLGGDVAFAWRGVSGSLEYLQVDHTFSMGSVLPAYRGNGFVAQAAYLLPLPGFAADRLEVGARFEEIDRNDTIPIVGKGDANQSLRYYTAALTWYQARHDLKLQLQLSHIVEVEDLDQNLRDATYANDTVLLQAQYRMESR